MIRIGKLHIKRDYIALAIFTIVQSIISWWAALDYGRSFQTASFSAAQLPLIGYTLAVAAAVFIILDRRIAPQWSLIAIGITVAFAFTNIIAKESELARDGCSTLRYAKLLWSSRFRRHHDVHDPSGRLRFTK